MLIPTVGVMAVLVLAFKHVHNGHLGAWKWPVVAVLLAWVVATSWFVQWFRRQQNYGLF
jgi:hypothetical protein